MAYCRENRAVLKYVYYMNIPSGTVITLFLMTLPATSGPSAAPVKVFILSGQSNMVGFGIPCYLTTEGIKNGGRCGNIRVYSAVDGDSTVSGPETLRAPLRSHPFFGPEIGIGEILSEFYKNDTIVFIKVA
jgi:hypothetical protein